MLILNDITPIHGHDPDRIGKQLAACIDARRCSSLLLDFQRQGCKETAALAKHLVEVLPCPVAVSECYGENMGCPVFLSPVPCHVPLEEHIQRWSGREVWLEIGLECERLTLTEKGCDILPLLPGEHPRQGQKEEQLHCHYQVALLDSEARFTLWRTREDIQDLLAEAGALGIRQTVGLWQELGT